MKIDWTTEAIEAGCDAYQTQAGSFPRQVRAALDAAVKAQGLADEIDGLEEEKAYLVEFNRHTRDELAALKEEWKKAQNASRANGFLPDWATYKHSLKYARADALEAAAKVAEGYVSDAGRNHGVRSYLAAEIAAAIRALKNV